jgi:ferric-dicitrate binding protein FerR (iron transport regulator)
VERHEIQELWSRHLAGQTLNPSDETALLEQVESDEALRSELCEDSKIDGMLQALGRSAHDAEIFAQLFVDRLRAEKDGAQFVARFQQRMAQSRAENTAPALPTRISARKSGVMRATGRSSRRMRSSVRRKPVKSAGSLLWPLAMAGVAALLLIVIQSSRTKVEPAPTIAVAPPAPAPAPAPAPTETPIAKVTRASNATLLLAGRKVPARAGDTLSTGNGISAGSDGSAEIAFLDGTKITLDADTELSEVSNPQLAQQGKRVVLNKGNIAADAAKQPDGAPLVVATPIAEIKIIGTQFSLLASSQQTRLEVTEGKVRLTRKADQAAIDVPAGNYVVADNDNPLTLNPINPPVAAIPVAPPPANVAAKPVTASSIYAVAFSPNGKTLASGYIYGPIQLWDVATWREKESLKAHKQGVAALAFSRDGSLLASGSADCSVKIWKTDTWTVRASQNAHANGVQSVAFSPDGKWLASGGKDFDVKLWDVETGQLRATLQGHTGIVWSVAFSADGQTLVSGSDDKTVRLWDLTTLKERAVLPQNNIVRAVACHPTSPLMLLGDFDGNVKILALPAGTEKTSFPAHGAFIRHITFSPDGKSFVTAGDDLTPKLWDLATLKNVKSFRGHEHSITSAAFSPDGRTLATSALDHTVRVWNLDTGEVIRTFTDPQSQP